MSHRERLAWVTVMSLMVPYVPYFVWAAVNPSMKPLPDVSTMRVFAVAAISHLAIYAVGAAVLRFSWPADALAKLDERDRAVSRKSLAASYGVLIAGLIIAGVVLPFDPGYSGWKQINVAILALVVSELVRCITVIRSYRRTSGGVV